MHRRVGRKRRVRLYLASTSPARLATLRAVGIEPITIPSRVDEEAAVAAAGPLTAAEMVQLLARLKAEAVLEPRWSTTAGSSTDSCSAATRRSSSTARSTASRTCPRSRANAGTRSAAARGCCTPGTG